MSNLTPDELARLRLRAKHGGTLTPEEQRAYDDYVTEQLSAVSSPPSGAVPPKKGFKWESEKVAEWRLKARHDGLDENERLLYQDYQQTLALAGASVEAENKACPPLTDASLCQWRAMARACSEAVVPPVRHPVRGVRGAPF